MTVWLFDGVCACVCMCMWARWRTFGRTPRYESASLLWHGAQSLSAIQNTNRHQEWKLNKLQQDRKPLLLTLFFLLYARTNSYWKPPTSLFILPFMPCCQTSNNNISQAFATHFFFFVVVKMLAALETPNNPHLQLATQNFPYVQAEITSNYIMRLQKASPKATQDMICRDAI